MNLITMWNDYRINRAISCFWLVVITFATLSPHIQTPSIITYQDKIEHIGAFAVLALFICRSFNPDTSYSSMDRVLIAMLIVTIYGAIDETIQGIVPARDPSILDLMADIGGAFLGGISFLFIPFFNNMK